MRQDPVAFQPLLSVGIADSMEDYISKTNAPVNNITFVGSATTTTAGGSSLNVSMPVCADGDVRFIMLDSDPIIPTTPIGWTALPTPTTVWHCYFRIKQAGDTDGVVNIPFNDVGIPADALAVAYHNVSGLNLSGGFSGTTQPVNVTTTAAASSVLVLARSVGTIPYTVDADIIGPARGTSISSQRITVAAITVGYIPPPMTTAGSNDLEMKTA